MRVKGVIGTLQDIPCFCITLRNLTMTFELGLIMTWRIPAFSALLMELRASLRTLVRTMIAVCVLSLRERLEKGVAATNVRFSGQRIGLRYL